MISLDKEKFERADRNKDGNLNEAEYSAFLHPYNHDHMRDLELKEILLDYDKNKDGAISFDEFLGDAEGYLFFVRWQWNLSFTVIQFDGHLPAQVREFTNMSCKGLFARNITITVSVKVTVKV